MLHLYLFSDDIEEFLVVAHSREDAFTVLDEEYGLDDSGAPAADALVLSGLYEYPDDFEFGRGITASYFVAKGRHLVYHRELHYEPKRFKRPPLDNEVKDAQA